MCKVHDKNTSLPQINAHRPLMVAPRREVMATTATAIFDFKARHLSLADQHHDVEVLFLS
jgi:hypothetical protein